MRATHDLQASPADLDRLFAACAGANAVVLAVSGGPDSMALLHLAARWAGARLHVATVDHGLRQASAAEARLVAAAAASLGLQHATLPWIGAKPATRRQERARTARYALLAAHAIAVGAPFVLTAHHADDQAETILMRLGRGSGIAGLCGMADATPLAAGVTLLRPLLALPKSALVAVCRDLGQHCVLDPSNSDPAFARARLRGQAVAADRLGLDRATLLRLGRRMFRAEAALDAETVRVAACLAPRCAQDEWHAFLCCLDVEPAPEILERLVRRAIDHVRATPAASIATPVRPLRLDRLETLGDKLATALARRQPLRATLGGACVSLSRDGALLVTREPARRRGRRTVDRRSTSN